MQRLTSAGALACALAAMPRPALAQDPRDPDEAKDDAKAAEDRRADEEAKRAEADAKDAEALARAKGVKLSFRLGVRFLSSSPFSKTYENVLTAYGYNSLSAVLEGAGDVAFSPWRYLDLGVHTGYSFGSGGSAGGSGGLLTLHAVELGGFAYVIFGRTDIRKAGTFGAGVEGGAMLPFLVLRGDVSTARLPYVGPVVLARLFGGTRVQTAVQARYLIANWTNALGTINLPLGGFSLSVGVNLSL